ncbi:MAG: substrate-binding domain-containing protein [Verrucomicrobiales bacterium]|nr:substrate-binding domain-containing protein [Verrucomicrobiales bacterium]
MRGIAIFIGLFYLSGCSSSDEVGSDELVMYCAAGMKNPVTRLAEDYRSEFDVNVRLHFGGSGTLLSSLQIVPGDLYLAADASYIDEAEEKGLVTKRFAIASMKAGLGVPKGNPLEIRALNDLKKEEIRVGIGNPDAASIGRFTREVLTRHGFGEDFAPTVTFPTVNELANAIKLNVVDVVIIWDAVASQYPEIDFVELPEFDAEKMVTIAITAGSRNPEGAERFCQFLTDPEAGLPVFQQEGFTVSE